MPNNILRQTGATLVELIISIIIISIALAGILGLVNLTVVHSADPLVQHQAIAIAESYIEEVALLAITDPDGTNAGETRSSYDNIDDYHGLSDNGAHDQLGDAITGLENYNVTIAINDQIISGVTMKAINVTVDRPGSSTINLTAYRANY